MTQQETNIAAFDLLVVSKMLKMYREFISAQYTTDSDAPTFEDWIDSIELPSEELNEYRTQPANAAPRFSIVRHNNELFVLENHTRKPSLIFDNENGQRSGKTIFADTKIEVVKYPAEMAFEMLSILRNK